MYQMAVVKMTSGLRPLWLIGAKDKRSWLPKMSCHQRFSFSREKSTSISLFTFLGISSSILAICTIFANILILRALRKCQNLHTPTKALLCGLAFSDLGIGIFVYPSFAGYSFAAAFDNIEAFCAIQGPYTIAAYCLGSVSFLTMTAISLDRFYAFNMRLRYHQIVTFKRIVLFLTAFWLFGLIWPFSWLISTKIANLIAAVVILTCIVISSISYINVTTGLRRYQRQIQKQCSVTQQHGGNLFRFGQYKNSVNTMILIFCLLLACYLPYFIVAIVTMVMGKSSSTMLAWNMTSAFVYLNSLLNPLVYCWRMGEIRRPVVIALKCFARWIFHWQIIPPRLGDFAKNFELRNTKQKICQ